MQYLVVAKLLLLLTAANGSPVAARKIFGDRFSQPLDANAVFIDGRPLLGKSKTFRGFLAAVLATAAAAPLLGFEFRIGLIVGLAAMAGDLFSSFVKRRLGLPSSSRATGLDQVPEALLPLLVCRDALSLTGIDIAAGTAIFFVGEVLLSRLMFTLHFRERPY